MIKDSDKEFYQSLISRIKQLRAEKGYSQVTLAVKANINESQIARIESGKSIPTLGTLKAIADGLEISMSELFQFK